MSKARSTTTLQLSDILGLPLSRTEADQYLSANQTVWKEFQAFPRDIREQIYLFLEGKRGLRFLYESFFQKLFHPDLKKERLEELISLILGQNVKILQALPREGNRLADAGSLVVMDIIVELENGSLVNVEMQLAGYLFPGERCSCYLSDMIMRLYNRTKERLGKHFSYREMKPVYLIVLMEHSSKEFEQQSYYIHRGNLQFNSGICVNSLENIVYISLDTYRKVSQNKGITTKLDAWLTFLSFNEPNKIIELVNCYPEFLSLYQEIAEFRRNPEEMVFMFSDALRIMDHNTTLYMIDEWKKELEEQKKEIDANRRQIDKQNSQIVKQNRQIDMQHREIDIQNLKISEQQKLLDEKDMRIAQLESLLQNLDIVK